MIIRKLAIIVALVSMTGMAVSAAELADLVKKLGSAVDADRAAAIEEIRKIKDADETLKKIEVTEKMENQQLFILRRIIGDYLVNKSPLKPIEPTTLKPFGEDKSTGAKGNADLLVDQDKKIIVMNGEFFLEQGPLEYLVVTKGPNARLHETITGVYAIPRDICTAMLVCAYTYAGELSEDGKINLPKDAGVMVSIEFEWELPHAKMGVEQDPEKKDPPPVVGEKKVVRVPIEYFAWNAQTEKTMKRMPFAFTGSKFEKDPESGKMIFMADFEKSIVAVKADQYAVMNTPLDTRDIDPQHVAGYGVNRHITPARGTKCRVVFEPWAGAELTAADLKDSGDKKLPGEAPAAAPTEVKGEK